MTNVVDLRGFLVSPELSLVQYSAVIGVQLELFACFWLQFQMGTAELQLQVQQARSDRAYLEQVLSQPQGSSPPKWQPGVTWPPFHGRRAAVQPAPEYPCAAPTFLQHAAQAREQPARSPRMPASACHVPPALQGAQGRRAHRLLLRLLPPPTTTTTTTTTNHASITTAGIITHTNNTILNPKSYV